MKTTIVKTVTCTLALLLALPFATTRAQSANSVSVQEAQQIATDVYIYGYPLVTIPPRQNRWHRFPLVSG